MDACLGLDPLDLQLQPLALDGFRWWVWARLVGGKSSEEGSVDPAREHNHFRQSLRSKFSLEVLTPSGMLSRHNLSGIWPPTGSTRIASFDAMAFAPRLRSTGMPFAALALAAATLAFTPASCSRLNSAAAIAAAACVAAREP